MKLESRQGTPAEALSTPQFWSEAMFRWERRSSGHRGKPGPGMCAENRKRSRVSTVSDAGASRSTIGFGILQQRPHSGGSQLSLSSLAGHAPKWRRSRLLAYLTCPGTLSLESEDVSAKVEPRTGKGSVRLRTQAPRRHGLRLPVAHRSLPLSALRMRHRVDRTPA